MIRRSLIWPCIFASAVACFFQLSGSASAQDQRDFVIRSDVRLVLLDVAVKDHNGGLVGNLTRNDFTVLEDGRPQNITAFANDDVPVTVGLLVDESRSMLHNRNEVLAAAGSFIRTCNPRDEIFVLNFNDFVKRGLPAPMLFSDNADQLRAALDRGVPRGMTALNDAVVEGLDQLTLGNREKKALVLISDGGDNASSHTRAEMFAKVEKSLATIYTIGLRDANDPDWNPHILRRLAHISGGESYFLDGPSGLKTICDQISQEIRTRYTIGYKPPPGKSGVLRHIQVRVSAPGRSGLTARSRTSYLFEDTPDEANE